MHDFQEEVRNVFPARDLVGVSITIYIVHHRDVWSLAVIQFRVDKTHRNCQNGRERGGRATELPTDDRRIYGTSGGENIAWLPPETGKAD